MAFQGPRGLDHLQETKQQHLYRDNRTIFVRLGATLKNPAVMAGAIFILAIGALFYPAVIDLILFVSVALTWWGLTREEDVPLRAPIQSGLAPGGREDYGKGIFFLGNDRKTNKEIWLTNDEARQHILVLGTTGAGKTENLIGFAANALTWSSGLMFCDGKGDVSTFAKIYALARRFGREDDILVLNFMTGNRDLGKSGGELLSNTLNPFSTGSSDALTQMVVSLMDDSGGDGAMWKGRATAMFTGVMRSLTWLRDNDQLDLNVGTIRDFLNLRAIIDLGDRAKYPDMPQAIRKSVSSYLTSLPGYQPEKGHKQAQTTLDQHGYLEMQFTKILGSLADVYGHIFATPYGEVDMYDVVINRRILVIMLPALEKNPDELANLGKIVVANLKGMMGQTLGNGIEGGWDKVVEKRLTTSPSPFIVVLDEVGYYTVEGMALMTAQARSLGFCLVLAAQDIPAMKKRDEKEAMSITGNTNTKIFMRTEEMEQTVGLAIASGGKGFRSQVQGFEAKSGEFTTSYQDGLSASMQQMDRIDPRDVRDQDPGEMILMNRDTVIYGRTFYAAPERSVDVNKLALGTNHFIPIPAPSRAELEQADKLPLIVAKLVSPAFSEEMQQAQADALAKAPAAAARGDEIAMMAQGFEVFVARNPGGSATEAACAALANLVRAQGDLGDALARDRQAASDRKAPPPGHIDLDDDNMFPGSRQIPLDDDFDAAPPPPPQRFRDDREAMPSREEMLAPNEIPPGLIDDLHDEHFPQQDVDAISEFDFSKADAFRSHSDERGRPPKAHVADVEHGVSISDRRVSTAGPSTFADDAVLRMLADLDYDPDQTTTEKVDQTIQADLGAAADVDFDNMAPSVEIDRVAAFSEVVRAEDEDAGGDERYISEFLDSLVDEDVR